MADRDLSHLRDRVGPPETPKEVEVKLHDATYNFGIAKYPGMNAHLGAIAIVNGWIGQGKDKDKVKVRVDEHVDEHGKHTFTRTFKFPTIHVGDKIKLPEASQLKELDRQAAEYWEKHYPVKAGSPKDPSSKDPQDKTKDKANEKTGEDAGKLKDGSAATLAAAKKIVQDLQTDLMQKRSDVDKQVGFLFGHGADAWENLYGHGSDSIKKTLNAKQDQIKEMGKQANEGKLDEFAKLHKSVTGAEFDPTKFNAKVAVEEDLKAFKKNHVGTLENLTEFATLGANWATMSQFGKAKNFAGLVKQGGAMSILSGAVKTLCKGFEPGGASAQDFLSGAGTGLAFYLSGKAMHHVNSKIHGTTLKSVLTRDIASGSVGGGLFGAMDNPNLMYSHARNEGRKYDAGNLLQDAATGAGGGFLFGGAFGALLGGGGYAWRKLQKPPVVGSPIKGLPGNENPKGLSGKQAEQPKQTQENPKAKEAEAKQAEEAQKAKQAEEAQKAKEAEAKKAEEAKAAEVPESYDINLKPWQEFQVPDNATWQQLKTAYTSLSKHASPDGVQSRLNLGHATDEAQAWLDSRSYAALTEFSKKANSIFSAIDKLGMPTMKFRDTYASPQAIKKWRELEKAYVELQKALESFKT